MSLATLWQRFLNFWRGLFNRTRIDDPMTTEQYEYNPPVPEQDLPDDWPDEYDPVYDPSWAALDEPEPEVVKKPRKTTKKTKTAKTTKKAKTTRSR